MTNPDQRIIRQSAAKALACLARTLEKEPAGSACWLQLVEALEALETIEAIADEARDAFTPIPSFYPPSAATQSERLALTQSLLRRQGAPERLRAA